MARAEVAKLPCVYCHSEDVRTRATTRDGTPDNPLLIRKRQCKACGGSFETLEILDRPLDPFVR